MAGEAGYGEARLCGAEQGKARRDEAGTERLVKASRGKVRYVPVRHGELRAGMAGRAGTAGRGWARRGLARRDVAGKV
jgi:hypothetical protein